MVIQETFKRVRRTSLLSRTLRQFACCTAVCFFLTAPLFYFLTKYYYAEDMIDLIEAVNAGKNIPQPDLEQDIMVGMMIQYMLIFCVITIAMFVTMRFATKRLWQPFDDTLLKIEHFNLAQSDIPSFAATNIKEFQRLNLSLERLMQKDKETYRIQKEFTENASHELQTPIAIIRSKLDLLMQENPGEKEARLIADLYEMTMRMGHLNRNLLLLAKIENSQYTSLQDIDVEKMISDSLPLYETLQNGTTIRLATSHRNNGTANDEDDEGSLRLKVQANPVLLECLLKNLIVNAIRHSPAHGEILIATDSRQLTVSNDSIDGRNGRPLDASTLFQRFHSGEGEAGTSRQKGNGLGLAIVKAICDFHHWSVEYRFIDGRHLFTVIFQEQAKV